MHALRKEDKGAGDQGNSDQPPDENLALSGYFHNHNLVGKLLFSQSKTDGFLLKPPPMWVLEFFRWLHRGSFILNRERRSTKMDKKFKALSYSTVNRWYQRSPKQWQKSPLSVPTRRYMVQTKKSTTENVELSIVIPVGL
jgi:hypothetical protein